MKGRAGIFIAIVGLAALVLTGCGSDTTVVSELNSQEGISVQGQGIAYGPPDVAEVEIGVQAQARTVAEAREQAASSMDAVIKSIKANGLTDADVRTVQFSVDPRYGQPVPGGQQPGQIVGYQVSNVITARVKKLDSIGKIVDDAAAAGGNNTVVRRVTFSILDQTKLQTEARELAVKDAKDRGDKMAQLNGLKLGRPVAINESLQPTVPIVTAPRTGETFASAQAATPIESGQLRVVVNVSIRYDID
jgi:uncharacterized protein YggE